MKQVILENDSQYIEVLLKYKYSLIQTSATWCGPCRRVKPLVKQLVSTIDNDNWVFVYCDVDKCPELSKQLKVKTIPCFYVYDKSASKVVDKLVSSDIKIIKRLCIKYGLIEENINLTNSNNQNNANNQNNYNYSQQHAQLRQQHQNHNQQQQQQQPQHKPLPDKYTGYWYNNQ